MFDFLSRWRSMRAIPADQEETLPWPVTQKARGKKGDLHLNPLAISGPIPRSSPGSLTGFDSDTTPTPTMAGQWHHPVPSPSRAPSNVAWLNSSSDSLVEDPVKTTGSFKAAPPPAVIRVDSVSSQSHVHPIGRSVSLPQTATPSFNPSSSQSQISSAASASASDLTTPSTRWGLRLHTTPGFTQSTHSLRLDSRPMTYSYSMDPYGNAYNYPMAKQLSPIAEQDYFSPDSLRHSNPLPGEGSGSDKAISASASMSFSQGNPSPGGSQGSEITRPSPVYSSPFLTRHLNRTISQTSSRTHISTTSSIPRRSSSKSIDPPSIPPLDLRPPFPGPHPNHNGAGPTLRPRRSTIVAMPTIASSTEGYVEDEEEYDGDGDRESLHAESFVTATSEANTAGRLASIHEMDADALSLDPVDQGSRAELASLPSVRSGQSRLPSASESFITRRWDRDVGLGNGVMPTFRAKRQWLTVTPAFWAFWIGFVCPFLWLIGGWHFTNFGEQPPRLTFWEFYFNAGYWKEKFCGGRDRKRELRTGKIYPPLPRWVAEKQLSDDGRARLNDPKRSLRGISFGYPFIPRPVTICQNRSLFRQLLDSIISVLVKPNRLFDQLYGVKLREVRGRPESGRRMFDPWIQRCRYAFCYAMILLSIGLCTTSIYLIIINTRKLH
ncbi:hypothetical protein BDQ12DRAFT_729619 [Crucibulum laeve]|uniref:Uncharacterized protein n=1 Tax=Crucibulum laeve TaxID=68775 RepID=A0A5C3LES8_9AGAR|nr:hypothetical protein BDQ12DRAFT_729619 [Crucibulum laeve]